MLAMTRTLLKSLAVITTLAFITTTVAQEDISFGTGRPVSEDGLSVDNGPMPGGAASKGKLARLVKTPAGVHDGRLVLIYGDANAYEQVWHPKSGLHSARDIFARFSDDEGATWSDPVNLSNSAGSYSAITDFDGDGVAEPYWGDSGKATVFNSGDTIVVSWTDKYAPEPDWEWGSSGTSALQGQVSYPDLDVYPNQHVVPFSALMLAVSNDGGTTWVHGGANPPLQMTYARRDALQDVHRGTSGKWVVTWQEDPAGLQTGEADGPGDGSSGATVTKGTDIWYAWTDDIKGDALALRENMTPLSDHSSYATSPEGGYVLFSMAGDVSNHGASRANLFLVKDGGVFKTLVAYEETKGVPDVLEGKTIQYHAFPYDAPPSVFGAGYVHGDPGTRLSDPLLNSRRVRFVVQPPDGANPALAIFWRQGMATEGGPADIMLKLSPWFDEPWVGVAWTLNMSTETPFATEESMWLRDSEYDPLEDARAHRAYMRGSLIVVGYSYTVNGPLARYTDTENYDFWIRRSVDGGANWMAPENISNLPDTSANVLEPRLVGPSKSGDQDDDAFMVAWGTETNVYEGVEEPVPLHLFMTRSFDRGETFDPVAVVTATEAAERESQFRLVDDVSKTYAVWMKTADDRTDVCFGISSPWQNLGSALSGALGEPFLVGSGPLTPKSATRFELTGAQPSAISMALLSLDITPTPFKGGTLLAFPLVASQIARTDGDGALEMATTWPWNAPPDLRFVVQIAVGDPGAPMGVALSNGVAGTSR